MTSFRPIAFAGSSFFVDNVRDFGRAELVRFDASAPELFGVAMEGFRSSAWLDARGRASGEYWLAQVPDEVAALAHRGRCVILFDMSNEGPPFLDDRMEALHASLKRRGLDPEGCVLLQQNRRLPQDYRGWAKRAGAPAMDCLIYDFFPRRMAGLLAGKTHGYRPSTAMRERSFLCPNFTPKPHRVSLVSWLISKGYSEAGFVSFRAENKNDPAYVLHTSADFPEQEAILRGLAVLKARAPILLDLGDEHTVSPDFSMIADAFYDQTYFSIVTESNLTDASVVRFSEKTIKPLAMHHPVLVVGCPHTLDLLRSFGFETFEEMFDETYDRIEDPRRRAEAILRELRRVLDLDRSVLHAIYRGLSDKLAHNAEVARRVLDEQYRSSLDAQLLRQILHGGNRSRSEG